MEFKVILTPQALADLQDILDYIAKDNPAAAQKLHAELHREALGLKTLPFRGARMRRNPDVRSIISGKYQIIYWVKNRKVVHILRFWHSARDIRRLQI